MKVNHLIATAYVLIGAMATAGGATMADELAVGDPAPEFTLPGSDGQTYKLSDLRGKAVIVAWYPKALTGG